jgi:hypothetical protein
VTETTGSPKSPTSGNSPHVTKDTSVALRGSAPDIVPIPVPYHFTNFLLSESAYHLAIFSLIRKSLDLPFPIQFLLHLFLPFTVRLIQMIPVFLLTNSLPPQSLIHSRHVLLSSHHWNCAWGDSRSPRIATLSNMIYIYFLNKNGTYLMCSI